MRGRKLTGRCVRERKGKENELNYERKRTDQEKCVRERERERERESEREREKDRGSEREREGGRERERTQK